MTKRFAAFALAACVWGCATAGAPAGYQPEQHWQALTHGDVEAAYQRLRDDHPAMSQALNDEAFRARLEAGRGLALQRAAQVTSFEGYLATLSGLANAAGDKHVWSGTNYLNDTVRWAGIVLSRRGDRFVVFEHDGAEGASSLRGAALLSCDGVSADDFAAAKLGGFRAVWSVEAQRIQSAPYLLVDDGNPFVMRPNACVFERDGQRIEHTLAWRDIARTDLRPRVRAAFNRGAPGHGLREFAGGYWIALQTLGDNASAVVDAVTENEARLRAAPMVVLDMRGNGGGNSEYGDRIARVLFGAERFATLAQGSVGEDCSTAWRVSPNNLAQMRAYQAQFRTSNPQFAAEMDRQVAAAEAAQAAGREFSGPTTCGEVSAPAADAPAQAARGRIVLLTDNACFSSCLIVADNFRKLGALHVGHATDAATHYFEVRSERLPSGLSYFSTLQAFSPAAPAQMGPFVPEIPYDGDMADTAALEAWVGQVAAR